MRVYNNANPKLGKVHGLSISHNQYSEDDAQMTTKIKAAVLDQPNVLAIKEVDMPKVGPGEVLVKVKAVGICGSDVHYYIEGRIGDYIVEKPIILGHETSGEIAEVGEGVTHLKKGDKVALEPGIPCGCCIQCKSGYYNLCADVKFHATPPYDGTFAQYVPPPRHVPAGRHG